uniref:rRNA-processing protein FYV7-like n=1 Tax=Styela clava TaxID=7725 RepID=UPI001939923E|nr:rRNA-processing protein FYV7-like [Styela clava]
MGKVKGRPQKSKFADDPLKKRSYYKYKKLLRKEGLQTQQDSSKQNEGRNQQTSGTKMPKKNTNRLIQTYEQSKTKRKSREEILKEQEERNRIRLEKKKLKKIDHQKLSKWTKKGQPVMKNKMEFMLDKIMNNKETYLS